jgi:hypothetical protein
MKLIMTCVRSIHYLLIKKKKKKKRSIHYLVLIRPGDPLSLYLFILCVKGLSSLIQKAEENRLITSVPITKGERGIKLSHLFLQTTAYYSVRPKPRSGAKIKSHMKKPQGQKLNMERTSIFSMVILAVKSRITFYLWQWYNQLAAMRKHYCHFTK